MSDATLLERIEQSGKEQKIIPDGSPTPYSIVTVEWELSLAEDGVRAGVKLNQREIARIQERFTSDILLVAQNGYLDQARGFAHRYNYLMPQIKKLQK